MQSVTDLIREVMLFIRELEVTSELVVSDFAQNYYLLDMDGRLPEAKNRMLQTLDRAMEVFRRREKDHGRVSGLRP